MASVRTLMFAASKADPACGEGLQVVMDFLDAVDDPSVPPLFRATAMMHFLQAIDARGCVIPPVLEARLDAQCGM